MTVEHFRAPVSQRLVAFNNSDDDIALLEDISFDDIREHIVDYERTRIEEYWETVLIQDSQKGTWIRAFDNSGAYSIYFKAPVLQRMSGTSLRGPALWAHLRSLAIDEQRKRVLAIRPRTRDELAPMMVHPHCIIGPDFTALLETAESPIAFLTQLKDAVQNQTTSERFHQIRYFELLIALWGKGLILFPLSISRWETNHKWMSFLNPRYAGDRGAIARSSIVKRRPNDSDLALCYISTAFAATDIQSSADFSAELLARLEVILTTLAEKRYPKEKSEKIWSKCRGRARSAVIWLRQVFNRDYPDQAIENERPERNDVPNNERRLNGKFDWLTTKRPELAVWSECFRKHIESTGRMRIEGLILNLNVLGDYLCTLENPPLSPWETVRNTHIYDASLKNENTFIEYLRGVDAKKSSARANTILSSAHKFFEWVADFVVSSVIPEAISFKNPVHLTDKASKRSNNHKSTRDSLPPYIVNEMKEILVENDFEFGRSYKPCTVKVYDNVTRSTTLAWDPSLTVCMYLLLETPLRSHQARWLDSGLLDESVLERSTMSYVKNDCPDAIVGRKEGALRVERDSLRSDKWLSLWVNTNKTAEYDSKTIGFNIPYVSEQLAALFAIQLDYQTRYLPPIKALVPYSDYKKDVRARLMLSAKLPQIAPLFRDSTTASQLKPLSYAKLRKFYTALLAETQRRIEIKYGQKLKLVTKSKNGTLRWAVDLHTLRISGITALIASGVPLEVVSQFVAGHQTLVMTLNYLKFSPAKLREFISIAHEKMKDDKDFVGSELFENYMEEFAPFMLGQDGAGTGPGYSALQEKTGILTITSEGICPGTSCDTGGPLASDKHHFTPVPGGKRCGLCRYWLTGPPHLLGQVAAVNNLAFTIRKKGLEVAQLNDERIDAEESGNRSRARELRDRIDMLNRELGVDVNEWVARYRYAEKSVALMDDYLKAKATVKGESLPVPFLTAGSPSELKVTLESAHEFALLDQITQTSQFVTGFRNREAELEKHLILTKLMTANGMRPFLLELSADQAHEAGNMLSAMVLQQVQGQELDEVLDGHKPLSDYPALCEAFVHLEKQTEANSLCSNPDWSRLESLLGIENAFPTDGEYEREFG